MLVVATAVREARGTFLMIYVVTFLFGVFRLRRRQFLALTAFALVSYGLVAWRVNQRGGAIDDHGLELFQFIALAVVLLWLSFFGSYVHRLREILRERNAELRDALETIRDLAVHDELTGTFTRRYIFELLGDEIERSARSGRAFSICLLDLDHFKQVNDTRGHLMGDAVLRAFAERVRAELRALDRIGFVRGAEQALGRYGGEEFLLLLPETDGQGALHCAERLRAAVHASPVEYQGERVEITVSIGAAEYSAEESVEALLARADTALYRAKQEGRDRCAIAAAPTA
jgi:diguanylate cyclase (GGDEF)-like protein